MVPLATLAAEHHESICMFHGGLNKHIRRTTVAQNIIAVARPKGQQVQYKTYLHFVVPPCLASAADAADQVVITHSRIRKHGANCEVLVYIYVETWMHGRTFGCRIQLAQIRTAARARSSCGMAT